ncbi:hypothetical protein ABH309_10530, partial [Chromobacterium piscinae]
TVVVTGVNDAAAFSGNDQGAVTEDANVSAANTLDYSGKLNVADVDQGQSSFDTSRVDNKTANLGSIPSTTAAPKFRRWAKATRFRCSSPSSPKTAPPARWCPSRCWAPTTPR